MPGKSVWMVYGLLALSDFRLRSSNCKMGLRKLLRSVIKFLERAGGTDRPSLKCFLRHLVS